jgi:G3E family GTPase
VVDSENFSLDLFNSEAAASQIAYGDIILLNKADLVDEADLDSLEVRIRDMKGGARIMRTTKGQVPLPLLLSVGLFETDKYFQNEEAEKGHDHHHHDHHDHHDDHNDCDHDRGVCTHDHHDHDHHSHHLENDGFTSISFESDKPFAIKKFQNFLDNQLPSTVFRAKGILWFDESPRRHIFHLCGKRFSIDDEDWKGQPKTQLVLIGQDLDKETLQQQIKSCVCLPSTTRGKGFGK